MNLEFIFKIIDKEEWEEAKLTGIYNGSDKDKKDGYIHFSEEEIEFLKGPNYSW